MTHKTKHLYYPDIVHSKTREWTNWFKRKRIII